MRVVLDTNIIVSRYLVAVGIPAQVMQAWREHQFEVVVSPPLLEEYEQVLNYRRIQIKHHLTSEEVAQEMGRLRANAFYVDLTEVPAVIAADPDDDMVLATAVAGEAEYIITGDPHLLSLHDYQGIRILTPATFLAFLATNP